MTLLLVFIVRTFCFRARGPLLVPKIKGTTELEHNDTFISVADVFSIIYPVQVDSWVGRERLNWYGMIPRD